MGDVAHKHTQDGFPTLCFSECSPLPVAEGFQSIRYRFAWVRGTNCHHLYFKESAGVAQLLKDPTTTGWVGWVLKDDRIMGWAGLEGALNITKL